jgi:flagellin-specific chaperone FliS
MNTYFVNWSVGQKTYIFHDRKCFIDYNKAMEFIDDLKRTYDGTTSRLMEANITIDCDSYSDKTVKKVVDCIDVLQNLKDKLIEEDSDESHAKCLSIDNSIESLLNIINSVLE